MKCINNSRRRFLLVTLAVTIVFLLTGCGKDSMPDAFSVDRPGTGISVSTGDSEFSYFAKNLCVTAHDEEKIEADTSESLSACFFDMSSKNVLYAKNVHERRYPASTTKIMTAYLALKYGELDSTAKVSTEAITFHEKGVSTAHLKAGDTLTLEQLLYALMLPSANDAANVIAQLIGGSIDGFVDMMNEEAHALGATHTHFVNPNGLHNEDHYTTVYDMYLMFNAALKYDMFREIIQTPSYKTTYRSAEGTEVEATFETTDQFTSGAVLPPDGVTAVGGKTGTTAKAKSCLVQLFTDNNGSEYAAIILGCNDRAILYQEMQSFLSVFNN